MAREHTITRKVQTAFGSLYAHVSDDGQFITEVRFSSPGKFADTTMGHVLDALGEAVTEVITELRP